MWRLVEKSAECRGGANGAEEETTKLGPSPSSRASPGAEKTKSDESSNDRRWLEQ
jgi:hypothetical protein